MADCELLKGCLFFNDKMKADEGVGKIFKKNIAWAAMPTVRDIRYLKHLDGIKYRTICTPICWTGQMS